MSIRDYPGERYEVQHWTSAVARAITAAERNGEPYAVLPVGRSFFVGPTAAYMPQFADRIAFSTGEA